jgi:hypothetical protein
MEKYMIMGFVGALAGAVIGGVWAVLKKKEWGRTPKIRFTQTNAKGTKLLILLECQ